MKKILFALMLLCPAMVANASTPTTPGVQEINKTCPKCKGKGKIRCTKCKGKGYKSLYVPSAGEIFAIGCTRCGGDNTVWTSGSGKMKCPTCKGKGKV